MQFTYMHLHGKVSLNCECMDAITPISFRYTAEKKEALERAAEDDSRSMSSLIDKILTDWPKANGDLKAKGKARG